MGTRGYIVYRYKARFLVRYNQFDSYPQGLGVGILRGIPTDLQAFQQWLESKRAMFEHRAMELMMDDRELREYISMERPSNDLLIEWIYEMDLDHLVFHIDSSPMFRLDHMPPKDIFLSSISFDHYGGRAYAKDTPEEYRYDWRTPQPHVDGAVLGGYKSLNATCMPIHELLAVQAELTHRDTVHVRFVEICVGSIITSIGTPFLRNMETLQDCTEMPEDVVGLAVAFVHTAICPLPSYLPGQNEYSLSSPKTLDNKIWWPLANVCVQLCTHLYDEKSLQAAISNISREVMSRPDEADVTYGVAFSFFHCAIVCVDRTAGLVIKHTPVLQFLPSYRTDSPSTDGITALTRLAQCLSVEGAVLWLYQRFDCHYEQDARNVVSFPLASRLDGLPVELLSQIASYLTTLPHLLAFALSSSQAMSTAENFLRYPHVNTYPLLSFVPLDPDGDDDESEKNTGYPRAALVAGRFNSSDSALIAVDSEMLSVESLLPSQAERGYKREVCQLPSFSSKGFCINDSVTLSSGSCGRSTSRGYNQ